MAGQKPRGRGGESPRGCQCRVWGLPLRADKGNDLVLTVLDILRGWAVNADAAAVAAGTLAEIAASGPLADMKSLLSNMISFLLFSIGGAALYPRGAFISQNKVVSFETFEHPNTPTCVTSSNLLISLVLHSILTKAAQCATQNKIMKYERTHSEDLEPRQ